MNTTAGCRPDSDRERITGWYHQHGPAVRGYVLAMVRRSDVADDMLQETFRKAWEARDRYQETGAARAYLLRIADRLVCDRARRSGRETSLEAAAWELCDSSPDSDPTLAVQQSEQRRRLIETLAELSPLQQRVLLLRYYSEMSFADIADTVGCPLSTALSHARRGLSVLRKRLVEVV